MKHACWTVRAVLAPILLMWILPMAESRGDLTYSLRFDQPMYEVNPGSTLTVDLILSELATGGSQNRLGFTDVDNDNRTYGLLGAEMLLRWLGDEAFVNKTSDAKAGAGFKHATGYPKFEGSTGITMKERLLDIEGDGVVGNQWPGSPGLHEIVLGQLMFTIPNTFSRSTSIIIDQQTPEADKDFVIKVGPNVDDVFYLDSVLTSGSSEIIAVPEPGTLVLGLFGITSVGGMALLRRRRQRQVHQVVAN